MPDGSVTRSGSASVRFVALQIVARQRAADAFEIGGDLAADVAAIEIVEAGMGEMRQRFGKSLLLERRADCRRLAVDEKRRGETRARL